MCIESGGVHLKYPFDCITDFVFVEEEEIVSSDIILVPGGSHNKPMRLASELYHAGMAPIYYLLEVSTQKSKLRNGNI